MPDSLLNPDARKGAETPRRAEPDRAGRRFGRFAGWNGSLPAAGLVTALLFTTGCSLFQKKQIRTYVPPPVQRPASPTLKLVDVDAPLLVAEAEVDLNIPEQEMVIPPPPPPPPPVRSRPPVVVSPKPPPTPVAPEPPPPKIALILPAEQLRAYNTELDSILGRDQRTLEILAGRNLAADQRDRVAQIRELLTQASKAREQDVVTAVSLARRADTLAKDLLNSVH